MAFSSNFDFVIKNFEKVIGIFIEKISVFSILFILKIS